MIHCEEENPSPEREHIVLGTREALFGNVDFEEVQRSHARQGASRDQGDASCQVVGRSVDGLCRQWYYRKRNEFELMHSPDWAGSRRRSELTSN